MINKSNDICLSEMCKVIETHTGLHFPVERWDVLAHNLTLASNEFGYENFDEFCKWIISTQLDKNKINLLAKFLTISETYFWRETAVFTALTDFILPEIIKSKHADDKTIRIWSAGCSTGEEAYSLAIALHKAIPKLEEWNILIMATDINTKSLEKARTGVYSQWSFRNCPSWLKTIYFKKLENNNFKILPEIKKMVTFKSLNLIDDVYPSMKNNTHSMDIIFCRNVLMYLTDEWFNKIKIKLSDALKTNGWFAVSSCELSSQLFPNFKAVNFPGAVIYHKSEKEFIPTYTGSSGNLEHLIETFSQFQQSVELEKGNNQPNLSFDYLISTIEKSDEVSTLVQLDIPELSPAEIENITTKIQGLANDGKLLEALALCEAGINENKLDLSLYFLKSSIYQELNLHDAAISTLKQTIYIDTHFVMGHFMLGNLYIRQGNEKGAKQHFRNVINLLANVEDEQILPGANGLSVKFILEIVNANMKNLN